MGYSIATTWKAAHLLLLLFLLLACSGLFSSTQAARLGNCSQTRSRRGGGGHGRQAGVVYQVGDKVGWTDIGENYRQWSSSKDFHIGDTIVFRYEKSRHRVFEVNREDFKSCNTHDPIGIRQSGYDSFTMTETSHRFFIDDKKSCLVGQKVDIRVLEHHHTNPSSSSISSQGHRKINHHLPTPPPPHPPSPSPPPPPPPFPSPSPSPQPSSSPTGSLAFSAAPSSQSPMFDDDIQVGKEAIIIVIVMLVLWSLLFFLSSFL